MPLYEYQCKKCKHRFEKIQKFSDPPVKKCPECGGAVEQLLSAPAVQFKGTGWYVTDYAKSGGGGKSSKDAEPSESSAGEAKESKPEKADKSADKSEDKKSKKKK